MSNKGHVVQLSHSSVCIYVCIIPKRSSSLPLSSQLVFLSPIPPFIPLCPLLPHFSDNIADSKNAAAGGMVRCVCVCVHVCVRVRVSMPHSI